MAETKLSVKQFAALTLGQAEPPWHLGNLLGVYGQSYLPLKETLEDLSAARVVMYVAMRTAADVNGCFGYAWNGVAPGRAGYDESMLESYWQGLWVAQDDVPVGDISTFQSVLKPFGASVVYVSPQVLDPAGHYTQPGSGIPSWATIGFEGTFGALANLPVQTFPFSPAQWSDEQFTTLSELTKGVVIVPAGYADTSAVLDLPGGGAVATGYVPGPAITTLMVVGGGTDD